MNIRVIPNNKAVSLHKVPNGTWLLYDGKIYLKLWLSFVGHTVGHMLMAANGHVTAGYSGDERVTIYEQVGTLILQEKG